MAKIPAPKTLDQNYEEWATKHDFKKNEKTKDDFKFIDKVHKHYQDSRRNRRTNCFWYTSYTDADTIGTTGGNWEKRWDLQEKVWLMWAKEPSLDSFEANAKSPMTTGRVETTFQKFKKLNIEYDAKPNTDDDVGKAKIAKIILDHIQRTGDIDKELALAVKDSMIHGSAFIRVYFLETKRSLTFREEDDEKLDEEQKKQVLDKKTPIYKKPKDVITFSDVVIEAIPIRELYLDSQAKHLHGVANQARYIIRRRLMSIDDCKVFFGNDPEARNIDMVKPTSSYVASDQYTFFRPPSDIINTTSVEIFEYENQLDDEYGVIANDILILRKPLPYNHKEITYHELPCIIFPHQQYHIGIPDLLMNLQTLEELTTNMMADKIFQSLNNQYFIAKNVYGETTKALLRSQNQFVPIDTAGGGGLQDKIMPMPYNPVGFDAFKLLEVLGKNATIATQIDPSQTSMIPTNAPATFGIISKEQTENMLSSIIDNFANYGLITAGRQIWALVRQFYKEPFVRNLMDYDESIEKFRQIRLDGFKVVEEKSKISIEEDKKNYSFLQIKPDYLNTKEDLDITISPDSLEVISKGIEMQKAQQALAQLSVYAVDPENPVSVQNNKMPLINGRKLMEYYIETNNLPEDLNLDKTVNKKVEVMEAMEESEKMLNGIAVAGTPGRSADHLKIHDMIQFNLQAQLNEYQYVAQQKAQSQPPQMDPSTGQMMPPQMDPKDQAKFEKINRTMDVMNKHISTDSLEAATLDQAMSGAAQQQAAQGQPAPMPPGGAPPPMQGGQPPMPPGSNVPMPQQGGGMPPMPAMLNQSDQQAGSNFSGLQ